MKTERPHHNHKKKNKSGKRGGNSVDLGNKRAKFTFWFPLLSSSFQKWRYWHYSVELFCFTVRNMAILWFLPWSLNIKAQNRIWSIKLHIQESGFWFYFLWLTCDFASIYLSSHILPCRSQHDSIICRVLADEFYILCALQGLDFSHHWNLFTTERTTQIKQQRKKGK